jgi:hypothetical protein
VETRAWFDDELSRSSRSRRAAYKSFLKGTVVRVDDANRDSRRRGGYGELRDRVHEVLNSAENRTEDDVFDTFLGDEESVDWVLGEWAWFVFAYVRAFDVAALTFDHANRQHRRHPEAEPGLAVAGHVAHGGVALQHLVPLSSSPLATHAPPRRAMSRHIHRVALAV